MCAVRADKKAQREKEDKEEQLRLVSLSAAVLMQQQLCDRVL